MNAFKFFIRSMVAVAALAGPVALTGCQDDFDVPPIDVPTATIQANTTIAELKAELWDDATNYATLVPKKANGEDYIIHGRVISSDASGNIYKSLVIQDETGALPMSINQNSLYNTYRIGQEIVINVTGIYIGKYAGYQQIGGYGEFNGTPQTSFMSYETFKEHAQLNGLPENQLTAVEMDGPRPTEGIYCVIGDLGQLPSTPEGQRAWQGQLVEFRNVHFEGGGSEPYVTGNANTSRTLLDAAGNSLVVRNSNYASFKNEIMPAGTGTVRGILSSFNGTYQLLLRSTADVIFDSKGNLDDPYSVAEAIELQGTGASGFVNGYIVGSLKAGVSSVTSNDNIIWGANADMDNTLVIGPTADCREYTQCLVVELPQGSAFRQYGNLVDNPAVYGKNIKAYGTFASVLGMNGLAGNTGATSEFVIEGVTPGGGSTGDAVASLFCDFEGYSKTISNLVKAGWTVTNTSGGKDWYLNEYQSNTYAAATAYKGTGSGPWDMWLISPAIDLSKSPKKTLEFITQAAYPSTNSEMRVYVMTSNDPNTATKTLLNPTLPEIPASGYSSWVPSGTLDLSAYSGIIYIGWEYTGTSTSGSSTYCIDNVNIGGAEQGGGGGGGDDPDPTGAGSEENPYSVGYVQKTTTDESGVWVEGYVVGYIKGTNWSSGSTWSNDLTGVAEDSQTGYVNSNFILGVAVGTNTTAQAIPCNIKAGAARDVLGFRSNPGIYLKHVKVKGDITKYFGQRGVKNIAEYKILD